MTKYDDVGWHLARDFPVDLPPSAAATHIGIFLGWAIESDLANPDLESDFPEVVSAFRKRDTTAPQLFLACCDGKLTSEDLTDEGNRFAKSYYDSEGYFEDYVDAAMQGGDANIFSVRDDWATYDRVCAVLNRRLRAWRDSQSH